MTGAADPHPQVSIPSEFFVRQLPAIDHLGELKLTLYLYWRLGREAPWSGVVRRDELLQDQRLLEGLPRQGLSREEALDEAIERAVARGTILQTEASLEGGGQDVCYAINSSTGRQSVDRLQASDRQLSASLSGARRLVDDQPNIFVLYEQNIGPLTPLLADELREAEASYPEQWIIDAVRIALANNVRKWSYVRAILEDWQVKGRDEREDLRDPEKARRRYVEGKFAEFIKR
jgi:DNA replication protein